MGNGANSQNEVASNSDATASSGESSSPAPTHTSASGTSYRCGRGKESRAGDFASSCVQLAHGRRVRVAGGDDQSRRWFPGAGRFSEGRDARKPRLCTRFGVYVDPIDEKTAPC